jgi:serine/threonine protein kinase
MLSRTTEFTQRGETNTMSDDPLISRTIGNYEIIDRIGKGGMATVYRARQVNMRRDVAIKVMSTELVENPQFVARFEREAQVIASLQHPRILPVHDFGREGETCYLVMRLVEGDTLYERLLQGALPLELAARFTTQIAEALDYAHAQGVVHRDLKPNNILIDKWENIYMMDFGLAKLVASSSHLTATGTVLGTPTYMAPEQWRGEAVDARTDVYSLGVILYEMVTGRAPFESDTPFTLMYKHIHDQPPSPRETLPDLPEPVEQVILRALVKDPAERYQSAGNLARAFKAVVRGEKPPTETPVKMPPPKTPAISPEAEAGPEAVILDPVPVDTTPSGVQATEPPSVPPIPVPSSPGVPVSESQLDLEVIEKSDRRRRPTPEHLPPPMRHVVQWAQDKADRVSIPGFIEPAVEEVTPPKIKLMEREFDSGEWEMPAGVRAQRMVAAALHQGEPLYGVLYLRGTADWRLWRRLFLIGLVLEIIGGIISLGPLHVLGFLCWLFLIVQGFRLWRGRIGHYYVGFTPTRIVVLPLTRDGDPRPSEMDSALWETIDRLRVTDEYLWLEASGVESVYVLGWIAKNGWGDLGRQRKWLLSSPIAGILQEKGYTIRT